MLNVSHTLISYLIQQCTQTNGIVLDGFLGSASTLIACEQLDRICYGVELEPKFVDFSGCRYLVGNHSCLEVRNRAVSYRRYKQKTSADETFRRHYGKKRC